MSVTWQQKWRRPRHHAKAVRCTQDAAGWRRLFKTSLIVVALIPIRLTTQQPAPAVEFAVEQNTRERWLYGRQQPRFTRFAESRSWLLIDSLRTNSDSLRRLYLTLGRSANGRDTAIVVFAAAGRVASLHAALAVRPAASYGRFFGGFRGVGAPPPEPRLWDLVPTFRAAPARSGARWTDTLARDAEHEGIRQSLHGTRVSTLVGDTSVNGRRLWIVRDSARVRYEERLLEFERTLDTVVTVTRAVIGTIRGRSLYDPELGLFRERLDSTVLAGEAVLRYPDGRAFPTVARHQRFRRWDLYDRSEYAARQAQLRAAEARAWGGMVRVPTTDLERRLSRGDTVARDSVLAEWQRADDPDRRERLFVLLSWSGPRHRLDSLRVASGDTAYLYQWLTGRAVSSSEPTKPHEMHDMIAFMNDPGLAFAFGQSRDWLYENLRQALVTSPPAIARDTSHGACTPAACRMLADQWRTAREQRLRELGLIALMTLDPARWSDTVLARNRSGSRFLEPAAMLARGVGATWPAASKAPIPAPNAEWHAWTEWMNGVDSSYAAERAALQRAGQLSMTSPDPSIRFEASHATAIRFVQARTGRDVIGELRRELERAQSDSARLVFGTMLQGLGELHPTLAQLANDLRSTEVSRHALAVRALLQRFREPTDLADSATAAPILDRLITLVIDGVPAWRPLRSDGAGWAHHGPELHQTPGRRDAFLLRDSVPPSLGEKWGARGALLTMDEWDRRPLTDAGVLYTLSSVRRAGPFVLVGVRASERVARNPGDAPRAYAAQVRYYLMDVGGEWVVVASDGWVT